MKLLELTYKWFSFLRMVAVSPDVKMSAADMKGRLHAMMDEMENKAASDSTLMQAFQRIKYPLAVFADEILITSEWEYGKDWFEERLEKQLFQSTVGGDKFFDDLKAEREKGASPEVIGIFFVCLSLGFKGKFFNSLDSLRSIHRELYNSLPQRITTRMDDLFPEAYFTDNRKPAQRPVAFLGKALFTMALTTVAFMVLCLVVWMIAR